MSETAPREWRLYIDDMIRFTERAMAYTAGLTRVSFVANPLIYDATLRNLELIGEAATKIPDPLRAANAAIPWRQIVATRNRLIHGYLGIDDDTIWSIIETDLPRLIVRLRQFDGTQEDPRS